MCESRRAYIMAMFNTKLCTEMGRKLPGALRVAIDLRDEMNIGGLSIWCMKMAVLAGDREVHGVWVEEYVPQIGRVLPQVLCQCMQ